MINVLLVDDNRTRINQIIETISSAGLSPVVNLVVCESADEARLELFSKYDLLILDVVLPKKIDSTPHASISMALLSDICNARKRYIRPTLMIGLTANLDELDQYKAEFSRNVTVVLDGSIYSNDWKNDILDSIRSLIGNQLKLIQREDDKFLITIHGIRTHGRWQQDLKSNLDKYSRDFTSIDFKYGFFDLLSFSIPPLRKKNTNIIAKRVAKALEENIDKDIHIVAHSYGTYILSRAIQLCSEQVKIKSTIMCGSPLEHDHDIDHIIMRSELTINECGTRDSILILARCFILGLGDAGRVGFSREHTSKFFNRFHKGGHSHYFEQKKSPNFYQRFWLPIMTTGAKPSMHDEREAYFAEGLLDIAIKTLTFAKPFFYIVIFYFLAISANKFLSRWFDF